MTTMFANAQHERRKEPNPAKGLEIGRFDFRLLVLSIVSLSDAFVVSCIKSDLTPFAFEAPRHGCGRVAPAAMWS
jgi:hypothetical protein